MFLQLMNAAGFQLTARVPYVSFIVVGATGDGKCMELALSVETSRLPSVVC